MELSSAQMTDAGRPWVGFEVLDRSGQAVGTLFSLWYHDGAEAVQFFGIQTAGSTGRGLVVPAEGVAVDARRRLVQLLYPRVLVQEGPAHACGAELTPEQERDIYLHYDVQVTAYPSADAPR